ncbi:DUF4262 domain-containing protein [Chitinophaga nivalis]|uniref:DUF4262 domain-containing protein n=1 Tax=Chitinophaga nivalis TaxID=2991709 RepID=A0ABT3ITJ7_9BACT|nr:DUF4262 domain-containing protein [Chitinophaga nivalis]MCW3463036.1 DUF4262 domain-containing protein [Chitinophaga nivalis]MCW3487274.1 DUF4262 domain-containing protein [Chitinophaga nivalis]
MTDDHDHHQHDLAAKQIILDDVAQYGCHLALLPADNYLPAFAYSIGLYKTFGHPELICFGLSTNVMAAILNHARDLIKNGERLHTDTLYDGFLTGYNIRFLEVDKAHYADYVGYGGWFYDGSFDFPLLQVIWPDKQHHFPWDKDFNPDWKFKQPLLDRNTDFKFYEERNIGVYVTSQAFKGDPILYVYHDEEGDWQFLTSETPDANDVKLVCLEEITRLDPGINHLFHLQYGWRAWRNTAGDAWQYAADTMEAES